MQIFNSQVYQRPITKTLFLNVLLGIPASLSMEEQSRPQINAQVPAVHVGNSPIQTVAEAKIASDIQATTNSQDCLRET